MRTFTVGSGDESCPASGRAGSRTGAAPPGCADARRAGRAGAEGCRPRARAEVGWVAGARFPRGRRGVPPVSGRPCGSTMTGCRSRSPDRCRAGRGAAGRPWLATYQRHAVQRGVGRAVGCGKGVAATVLTTQVGAELCRVTRVGSLKPMQALATALRVGPGQPPILCHLWVT